MKNFKKMLSIILLCLLLLPIILSCGSESPPDESNTTETSIYEITSETDTPVYNIEAVDYKGIEFNFLCRDALFQTPEMHDLFSEGNNGEILNDTIYLRNSIVEEKYNVHINTNIVAHTELINRASNSIMAGDKDFDVVLSAPGQNFTLATRGYIVPFNDLPVVDIENEWWMRSFMEDSSIHGKNYVAVGDMNIGAMNAVGVTFFNKKLTNSLGIEDPYELVKNGDWTFDVLIELTAGISSDLNGDSIMDELDRYGMITNVATWYGLFYGAGGMIIEKTPAVIL